MILIDETDCLLGSSPPCCHASWLSEGLASAGREEAAEKFRSDESMLSFVFALVVEPPPALESSGKYSLGRVLGTTVCGETSESGLRVLCSRFVDASMTDRRSVSRVCRPWGLIGAFCVR